jgi:hypothetical protein
MYRYKAASNNYANRHKRYQVCELFMLWKGLPYPRCHCRLRTKPRNVKFRRSRLMCFFKWRFKGIVAIWRFFDFANALLSNLWVICSAANSNKEVDGFAAIYVSCIQSHDQEIYLGQTTIRLRAANGFTRQDTGLPQQCK